MSLFTMWEQARVQQTKINTASAECTQTGKEKENSWPYYTLLSTNERVPNVQAITFCVALKYN